MLEFTLFYRGPLRANGNPKHKQEIRDAFHSQLKQLWTVEPLVDWKRHCLTQNDPDTLIYLVQEIGPLKVAPLVCEKLHLTARLEICLLRPEPPGKIITQGGDIDNRLKTLFDALRMPSNSKEIPKDYILSDPILFTLLEDDNLITHVGVRTEQLLQDIEDRSEVILTVKVTTHSNHPGWGASALG